MAARLHSAIRLLALADALPYAVDVQSDFLLGSAGTSCLQLRRPTVQRVQRRTAGEQFSVLLMSKIVRHLG